MNVLRRMVAWWQERQQRRQYSCEQRWIADHDILPAWIDRRDHSSPPELD